MHKPIKIHDISLYFPHKVCFEDFSAQVLYGSKIGIIGRNGSGKSSLLKLLIGMIPPEVTIALVPQIIETEDPLSGGQRFNQALTAALSQIPDILCLDEPTNHLDRSNRQSLIRMLRSYPGTLLVVTHDKEVLRSLIETIWHIDQGKIISFSGSYDDYLRERAIERQSLEQEISRLNRDKKQMHESLMKEQHRAAKSKSKGEKSIDQRKWPTVVSKAKALNASETSGKKKSEIRSKKSNLLDKLSELKQPEMIVPTFSLSASEIGSNMLLSISKGAVGYSSDKMILKDINLSVSPRQHFALLGDNGSGKTTLVKAILRDPNLFTSGDWILPKPEDIGYLDQHYGTLDSNQTILDFIQNLVPTWTQVEARRHLNDFLFRKNEEVNALISTLSGGEKARLSLAQIAAKTPRLLILDEVTNNIDLETKNHIIEVLKSYPGAMILISHDQDFFEEIGIDSEFICTHSFNQNG
jgi:ATPase subunit of ABC transporter with duplicated ATPase domains